MSDTHSESIHNLKEAEIVKNNVESIESNSKPVTKSVTKEPVTKEPVTKEPVTEEPVAEEPVAEEPVAEEPVAEEPVAEEPVAEEPVAEEPTKVEEPVAEEPTKVEEPVTKEPVTKEPTKVEEPVAEEPVAKKLVVKSDDLCSLKTLINVLGKWCNKEIIRGNVYTELKEGIEVDENLDNIEKTCELLKLWINEGTSTFKSHNHFLNMDGYTLVGESKNLSDERKVKVLKTLTELVINVSNKRISDERRNNILNNL